MGVWRLEEHQRVNQSRILYDVDGFSAQLHTFISTFLQSCLQQMKCFLEFYSQRWKGNYLLSLSVKWE